MRFLVETGSESHTTSWQKMQAKFVGGALDGKFLYQQKSAIVSQEWLQRDKHVTLVRTVYELPAGTEILIDYSGHEGPEKFVIRLDESQEVQEYEVGTSRLPTYTIKGRYIKTRDLIQEREHAVKKSQEEGF